MIEKNPEDTLKSIKAINNAKESVFYKSDLLKYLLGIPEQKLFEKGEKQPQKKAKADTVTTKIDTLPVDKELDREKLKPQLKPDKEWYEKLYNCFNNLIHKVFEGPKPKHYALEPALGKESGIIEHDIAWLLWWGI